jgi:aminoglycoside 6'-N-acetyltransferase I
VIELLEPADVEAWSAMRALLWTDADAEELTRECHDFVRGVEVPSIGTVFVAKDERAAPVGFLELAVRAFSDGCESMPVPHIEAWYVRPEGRRKGFGRALMAAAEDWARARGFTEIASDTEVDNEVSLRAHERCGYAEVERLIKLRKPLA